MALRSGRAESFLPRVANVPAGHSTYAEVNLDAIAGNISSFRRYVRGAEVMAVVKANAYGHGAVPVARAALEGGATRLGVYTTDEGVLLRLAGIEAPILVFGPIHPAEAPDVWAHRLTPTVTCWEVGRALQDAAGEGILPFHLKLDTGLTRAGAACSEAVTLMERLAGLPSLRAEGVFTHFARADERDKRHTLQQLRIFHETVDCLEAAGHRFALRHAANSAAAIDLPDSWLDMVRIGISTYGYYPSVEVQRNLPLRPALSLISTITRVTRIPAGTGVGYGHEYVAVSDATIALVPVGYGHGLPRTLGNGHGRALIRGQAAPIVGRVSMDQITVDVTELPSVAPGDEAVLIGAQGGREQTAEHLAHQAGTISYHILTGLLPRVPRVYTRQGSVVGIQRLSGETG